MLKEELKNLYKAKPELIEEHKRLVDVLRTGSKKEQIKEAERQLKELKEMISKADDLNDKKQSAITMDHVKHIATIKDHEAAKAQAHSLVDSSRSVSLAKKNILKSTIDKSKNTKDLALKLSEHVLTHGSRKFKVKSAQADGKKVRRLHTLTEKEQYLHPQNAYLRKNDDFSKADRCWEGYEPTPGKKPYEKGSCQPIKKEESSGRGWQIKIKNKPGYHDVKDVVDMGPQQHNSYVLHDGTQVHHDQVEDLTISPKRGPVNIRKEDIEKSNYGPKGMDLYNPTDNIKRKSTRTGEVREDVGQNKAVRQYTSSKYGTAAQQATSQAKSDKKKSAKNPVRSMAEMSEAELNAIKARYAAKTDLDDKIVAIKAKYSQPKEKSFDQQVKDIKQKYAQKPEPSEDQRIGAMKMKYTSMFKSDGIQNLLKEVSVRQPTDAEFEVLLDYNSKIQQNLADNSMVNEKEQDLGY